MMPHEMLVTIRQKAKLRNAFNKNMSNDLKLSKAQISKTARFLGSLLRKLAGPLMKVAVPLGKYILAPLGITVAALAIDAGIGKKKKKVQVVLCPSTSRTKNLNNFKRRNK